MRSNTRRHITTAFAVVALIAVGAKAFKAYYRGDTMQSRVHPLK